VSGSRCQIKRIYSAQPHHIADLRTSRVVTHFNFRIKTSMQAPRISETEKKRGTCARRGKRARGGVCGCGQEEVGEDDKDV
jgi:hypothetical protein